MHHIIQKQVFDLQVHRRLDALALQQRVSDRFPVDILPELEHRLNQASDEDSIITIGKLEIDLGLITEGMIDTGEWALLFRVQLEKALQKSMNDPVLRQDTIIIPLADSIFSQWYFFIGHGYLPWNAGLPRPEWLDQVLESLAGNYNSASALRKLIGRKAGAAERIVWQHSPVFLSHLAELLTAKKQDRLGTAVLAMAAWLTAICKNFSPLMVPTRKTAEQKIWMLILQKAAAGGELLDTPSLLAHVVRDGVRLLPGSLSFLISQPSYVPDSPEILQAIRLVIKNEPGIDTADNISSQHRQIENKLPDRTVTTTGSAEDKTPNEPPVPWHEMTAGELSVALEESMKMFSRDTQGELLPTREQAAAVAEGVYIVHAGLVLLHPFLHAFFRKLGLIREGRFESEAAQERAVCLLHELAASGSLPQEYEMVMEKLLCGWPLHKPVDTGIELTPAERAEAQRLLQAAIEQWEILRNTTPAALQETFLQRRGKLISKNEKWYLYVEKEAIDLLLKHLPWMISMIKLPWMKELLLVEWT